MLYRWTKDCGAYRGTGKRVLIVGAGTAGEMLARDLLRAREREYRPVAFVDDNPAKQSAEIHGIRVMGRCADISARCMNACRAPTARTSRSHSNAAQRPQPKSHMRKSHMRKWH